MEMFYTIQGEGFNTGTAAFFIRLGGCDVGCHWCDVKDSWDAGKHAVRSIDDILDEIEQHPVQNVVITGGEPGMYDLNPLCDALHEMDMQVFLETSGAYDLKGDFDWVCVSPKKFKAPLPASLQRADELKVVIFHPSDFQWAEEHAEATNDDCFLYLQPEWEKASTMLPIIIEYVKQNPKWQISLQTHKWMNIP